MEIINIFLITRCSGVGMTREGSTTAGIVMAPGVISPESPSRGIPGEKNHFDNY